MQLEVKGRLALHKLDHFLTELRHSRSRTGELEQLSGRRVGPARTRVSQRTPVQGTRVSQPVGCK